MNQTIKENSLNAVLFEDLACRAQAQCSGQFACAFIDLNYGTQYHFHSHEVLFPGSIIKIPILIELYARVEKGELLLDQTIELSEADVVGGSGILFELHRGIELTLQDLASLMIVLSDNTASNILIDVLGMDAINKRIQTIGMHNSRLGRKFMTYKESLDEQNKTTAWDLALCFARLYAGELLNLQLTEKAISLFKRQQYREKIPLLLPKTFPIANKIGELAKSRHDVALILHPDRPYVLACMMWDLQEALLGDQIIANFSKQLFDSL